MRYLIPLLLVSSTALADGTLYYDGYNYRYSQSPTFQLPQPYSNNMGGAIANFGSRPSLGQQIQQQRYYQQQIELMQLQNELLRRQMGR